MHSREQIQQRLDELRSAYGDWTNDIPLPFDIWTKGNLQIPHTRLKRIVQAVSDLSLKPLAGCRILDLGSLDGLFPIEFALQGADTIGVEVREANLQKALFTKEILDLRNLEFRQDDVRNISVGSYGRFDAIICSGILYHLTADDAIKLVLTMHEMTTRLVVIDTHVALEPDERVLHGDDEYWGTIFREHSDHATAEEKAKSLLASADNLTSFWFTRPSLINILTKAGFSSIYECFAPAHVNYGQPGIEHRNRCTFIAVKNNACSLKTSPAANGHQEQWPEGSLTYARERRRSWYKRALKKLSGRKS